MAEQFPTMAAGGCGPASDALLRSLRAHFPAIDPGAFSLVVSLAGAALQLELLGDSILRPFALSRSKLFVLLWLRALEEDGHDGLAPSALSEQMRLTRSTISTLLAGLETQRYITRELDARDKRRFVMRVTPLGTAAAQRCTSALFQQLTSVLLYLGAERCHTLCGDLDQLQRVLRDRQSPAAPDACAAPHSGESPAP